MEELAILDKKTLDKFNEKIKGVHLLIIGKVKLKKYSGGRKFVLYHNNT